MARPNNALPLRCPEMEMVEMEMEMVGSTISKPFPFPNFDHFHFHFQPGSSANFQNGDFLDGIYFDEICRRLACESTQLREKRRFMHSWGLDEVLGVDTHLEFWTGNFGNGNGGNGNGNIGVEMEMETEIVQISINFHF